MQTAEPKTQSNSWKILTIHYSHQWYRELLKRQKVNIKLKETLWSLTPYWIFNFQNCTKQQEIGPTILRVRGAAITAISSAGPSDPASSSPTELCPQSYREKAVRLTSTAAFTQNSGFIFVVLWRIYSLKEVRTVDETESKQFKNITLFFCFR